MKIAGLVFGVGLILGAWYLGAEWWTTPVQFTFKTFQSRPPTERRELAGVILAVVFVSYIAWVIDRYRTR